MASARWRSARSIARATCGVIAAVLLVTGCVNMPSSGPPSSLQVNQSDTGQNQDYVGPVPAGPGPNWTPAQIVEGFLFASASYYTAGAIAKEYLTPAAQKTWNTAGSVTVYQSWNVSAPTISAPKAGAPQATVTVSGQVEARLNGSGQYASVAQSNQVPTQSPAAGSGSCPQPGSQSGSCYPFTLVKSAGQWRIARAPAYLLLDASDFERAWASQDLYFFDASQQVLVPDSVFVPLGTSETDLLNKLAAALQKGPAPWLTGATVSVFPANIAPISVTADGNTAIVSLKGTLTHAEQQNLKYVLAELVWTLTSSVSQSPIQSVVLNVNGTQWNPSPESRTAESAYDPYPGNPASFTYVADGVVRSLCGSAQGATAVQSIPVFGHSGGGQLASCQQAAGAAASPTAGRTAPSGKPARPGNPAKNGNQTVPSMVAVSPDGSAVAVVSSGGSNLSIGPLRGHTALKPVPGFDPGITSISWDRQNDLWVTQGGNVWMVPMNGKPTPISFAGSAGSSGYVTALSVAPDGVRVAMIMQRPGTADTALKLAAINPNGQPSSHGSDLGRPTIGQTLPLGPGIANSVALAWYDADNLIVLNRTGASQFDKVPVDGRAASQPVAALQTPPGVTVDSIAAANQSNVVVAGLSNGQLEVLANLEGPWQSAGAGSEPAYSIPLASPKGS
jgi:hypothetical protein